MGAMNVVVVGWPGAGKTTLSGMLARVLQIVTQLYHDVDDWAIPEPDDDIWRYNGPWGYASALDGTLSHGRIRPASATPD